MPAAVLPRVPWELEEAREAERNAEKRLRTVALDKTTTEDDIRQAILNLRIRTEQRARIEARLYTIR